MAYLHQPADMAATEALDDAGCPGACFFRWRNLSIYCRDLQHSAREAHVSVGLVWRRHEVPARPASLCCSTTSQASADEVNIDGCRSSWIGRRHCEVSGVRLY